MPQPGIEPSTVTKPIQLLAAWWAGLILIDSGFLAAASQIEKPDWAPGALVLAAILYVPFIVILLFYMQTKFRQELLGDADYVRHLKIKSSSTTGKLQIVSAVGTEIAGTPNLDLPAPDAIGSKSGIAINDLLPDFREIVASLSAAGLQIDSTFGSTSANPEVPDPFIVTIGRSYDLHLMQKVIGILDHFSLEGVYLSLREANEDQIYIGAYNYKTSPDRIQAFDSAFKSLLLNPELTRKDLIRLVTSNEVTLEPRLAGLVDAPVS